MAKLTTIFDNDIPSPPKASQSGYPAYQGASLSRLNADWIGSLLSADHEVRNSLKRLRARCRQLANNNDYVARFVNLVKQNVVGPNGIQLEFQLPEGSDELAEQVEEELERAWNCWTKRKNCTASGKMSFRDVLGVAFETLVIDGECFIRKVKGFPGNPFAYALQFMDPDLFDANFNRGRRSEGGQMQNEVRMSIEVDQWGRDVAYWAYDGHPSEGGARRIRIPAEEMIHLYVIRRGNQTRGVPFLHTAMTRLNMLGGYEEAELVAARVSASKMAFFTSKTGEEYQGGGRDKESGAVSVTVEPASMEQLPDGVDVKVVDWQHPQVGFEEFVKAMLRGVAVGINCSYSSLTGDLRDVNFSSIRQGVLDERDGWRVMQTFAIEGLCEPVLEDWVPMALLTKQARVPTPPADEKDLYVEAAIWRPRGWTWVDPLKDVQAVIMARRAGLGTLASGCAAQGLDYRDVIDQIATEDAYAKKKGVTLDFSAQGPVRDNNGALTDATPTGGKPGKNNPDGNEEEE